MNLVQSEGTSTSGANYAFPGGVNRDTGGMAKIIHPLSKKDIRASIPGDKIAKHGHDFFQSGAAGLEGDDYVLPGRGSA